MFKRQYCYLVAGLADLIFDSGKVIPDLVEFREELKEALHPSDYYLVSILFLPYDHDNMIAFFEGKTDKWNIHGNFSPDEFEEEKKLLLTIGRRKDAMPSYMVEQMALRSGEEQSVDRVFTWQKLTEGYINLVMRSGNRFLERWISYDSDIRNIFALLNAREMGLDAARYIVGGSNLARELLTAFSSGKELAIPLEPDYVPVIFRIATENEFLERERKIDLERWAYIDSITLFEYFTIDLILGYLIKYMMVLRWKQLDPVTGESMLRKLIDQMETRAMSAGIGD